MQAQPSQGVRAEIWLQCRFKNLGQESINPKVCGLRPSLNSLPSIRFPGKEYWRTKTTTVQVLSFSGWDSGIILAFLQVDYKWNWPPNATVHVILWQHKFHPEFVLWDEAVCDLPNNTVFIGTAGQIVHNKSLLWGSVSHSLRHLQLRVGQLWETHRDPIGDRVVHKKSCSWGQVIFHPRHQWANLYFQIKTCV